MYSLTSRIVLTLQLLSTISMGETTSTSTSSTMTATTTSITSSTTTDGCLDLHANGNDVCGEQKGNKATTYADEIEAWLELQNLARKNVQPKATPPIKPLLWDRNLAMLAAEAAKTCKYEHTLLTWRSTRYQAYHERTQTNPDWKKDDAIGVNLAADCGLSTPKNDAYRTAYIRSRTQQWIDEHTAMSRNGRYYKYEKIWDLDFPHYTQIIWQATKRVGCAWTQCDNIMNDGTPPCYFYVCFYHPHGNYMYRYPYSTGK